LRDRGYRGSKLLHKIASGLKIYAIREEVFVVLKGLIRIRTEYMFKNLIKMADAQKILTIIG
jgi:hypothetical protein